MTYEEFQRQLGKANLNNGQFASLLKMNRNSVTNYRKAQTVPMHIAVIAVLMAEMVERGMDFRSAIAKVGVVPKKPRGAGIAGAFGGKKHRLEKQPDGGIG